MMNKENVEKKKVMYEMTTREKAAVRWVAGRSYEEIKSYFYDERNEELVPQYINVISLLRKECDTDALCFVCTLLEQAYCNELLDIITDLCRPESEDESITIFINTFLTTAYFDLLEDDEEEDDEFEDDELELYDVNFDPEMDEDPFAVIKVTVDSEKAPAVRRLVENILCMLRSGSNDLKPKECEEDE